MEYQVIDEAEAREQLRRAALDELSRIELDHLRQTVMLEADEAAGKNVRWREKTIEALETEHSALIDSTPPEFLLPIPDEVEISDESIEEDDPSKT